MACLAPLPGPGLQAVTARSDVRIMDDTPNHTGDDNAGDTGTDAAEADVTPDTGLTPEDATMESLHAALAELKEATESLAGLSDEERAAKAREIADTAADIDRQLAEAARDNE